MIIINKYIKVAARRNKWNYLWLQLIRVRTAVLEFYFIFFFKKAILGWRWLSTRMNCQEKEWTVLQIFKNSLDKYVPAIIWLTHAWGKGRSLAIYYGSVYGELNFAIQLVIYFSLSLAFD